MPDQPYLPIDDEPPAELDPMGVSRGEGDDGTVSTLNAAEASMNRSGPR